MESRSLRCCLLAALALLAQGASDVEREMLQAHNAVRKKVGTPPLVWSKRLEAVAREWADSLAKSGRFAHRPSSPYGENLYEISGGLADPAEVVSSWASESRDFNAAKNACRAGAVCGHYTQVVWRGTTEVGCSAARAGSRQVWVCNYSPPGNIVGRKPF